MGGCQCLHCLLQTLGKCTVSLQPPSLPPRPTQGTGASSSICLHNVPTLIVGITEGMARGSLLRAGTEPSFSQNEPSTPEIQVISILKEDLCVVGRTDNVASYLLLTSALASAAVGPARCPLSYSQGASGCLGKGEFVSYSYHGDFESLARTIGNRNLQPGAIRGERGC